MAITHVGTPQGTGNTATSLNIPSYTAAAIGNLLVVGGAVANGTGTTWAGATPISDTQGNVWTKATGLPFLDATNTNSQICWFALAKNTSAMSITINSNVASAFMSLTIDEFSGNDKVTGGLDVVAHSLTGQTGTPISQSFTPGFDNELVWAFATDSVTAAGNIDGSAGTLGGLDGFQDDAEYRILTGRSGVSMTAAFTGSGAYDVIIVTFRPPLANVAFRNVTRPFPFAPGAPNRR